MVYKKHFRAKICSEVLFTLRKFISKIARSGFYIILFLCISAIGISGYVMYIARDTAKSVKESISIDDSIELPFPTQSETMYDFGEKIEVPDISPEAEEVKPSASETEKEKKQEPKPEQKKAEPATPTVSTAKKEASVYTMAVNGAISSPFSGEELVKSKTMGDWRIHSGVDIKGDIGTDVRAVCDGTVKSVETDSMMGNVIKIEHADGLVSIYANLSDGITLKPNDTVKSGDVIAKIGQSALCECLEPPHLHLEVTKDEKHIDPLSLFPAGEE